MTTPNPPRQNRKLTKAQMRALEAINGRRYADTHGTSTSRLLLYGCLVQDRDRGYPGHVLTTRGRAALKTGIVDYSVPATRQQYAQQDRELWEMRLGDSFSDYALRTPIDGGFIAVNYQGRVCLLRQPTEHDFKIASYALTFQEVDAVTRLKAAFAAAPSPLKERNKIISLPPTDSHEREWLRVAHLRQDLQRASARADAAEQALDALQALLTSTKEAHEEYTDNQARQHEADLQARDDAYERLRDRKEDDLW